MWKQGQVAIGTGISFSDPSVIELCGAAGLDIAFIDLEHGALSLETAKTHIMVARGAGLAAFVRVPSYDPVVIKPVADLHPAAIIVPRIRNAREAATAVSACKYPPTGARGFGPMRGMDYGSLTQDEYLRVANEQTMVIVQIEEAGAVDAILTTPGVDSIMLGPNDLSGSLGFMAQHDHPTVVAAIDKTIERAKAHNVPVGVGAGAGTDSIRRWIGDWGSLHAYNSAMVASVREIESAERSG